MALTTWNGSNGKTAESVTSVSAWETFVTEYYAESLTGTTAEKESTLRRANAFMLALPWRGVPTDGYEQSIPFPRKSLTDANGFEIPKDKVPPDVIKAAHMLARTEHATIGALSPVGTITDARKRVKIDTLEVEYQTPDQARADASRQVVSEAINLLRKYLTVGALEKMGLAEYSRSWGVASV